MAPARSAPIHSPSRGSRPARARRAPALGLGALAVLAGVACGDGGSDAPIDPDASSSSPDGGAPGGDAGAQRPDGGAPLEDGGTGLGLDGGETPASTPGRASYAPWPELRTPFTIAAGAAGEVWVTDALGGDARRLSASGVTTRVLSGMAAAFPFGLAVDVAGGRVFVSDPTRGTVEAFTALGAPLFVAGPPILMRPYGLAIDANGVLIVADAGHGRLIALDASGAELPLDLGAAALSEPRALAIGRTGAAWVVEAGTGRVVELGAGGARLRELTGAEPGATAFAGPTGVAVDGLDQVWITDVGCRCAQVFSPSGTYVSRIDDPELIAPEGIAIDAAGRPWITDAARGKVNRYDAAGARVSSVGGGPAQLASPRGLTVAPDGRLWLADTGNRLVYAMEDGRARSAIDGTNATTPLWSPLAVAVAEDGTHFIADMGAGVIVVLEADGTVRARWDGTAGDGLPFGAPTSLALDADGDVWVTDGDTSAVRELAPDGTTRSSLDGSAGGTAFIRPRAITVDPDTGALWIADPGTHTVQAFDAGGRFLAKLDDGSAGAVALSAPSALAVRDGTVWVADAATGLVQSFDTEGRFRSRLSGGEVPFRTPEGIAVDAAGNVYVSDSSVSALFTFTAAEAAAGRLRRASTATSGRGVAGRRLDIQLSGSLSFRTKAYRPGRPEDTRESIAESSWALVWTFDETVGRYVVDTAATFARGQRIDFTTGSFAATLCEGAGFIPNLEQALMSGGASSLQLVEGETPTGLRTFGELTLIGPFLLRRECPNGSGGMIQDSFIPSPRPDDWANPGFGLPFGTASVEFPSELLQASGSPELWRFDRTVPFNTTLNGGDRYESTWTMHLELRGLSPGAHAVLGDSFASGAGVHPVSGPCAQSPNAWGRLYDTRPTPNTIFKACSSATTAHLDLGSSGSRQLDGVPRSSASVALTIGGNDANLFGILNYCTFKSAFYGAPFIGGSCVDQEAAMMRLATEAEPKIERALRSIQAQSPNAKVAILEYPDGLPANERSCDELRIPPDRVLGLRDMDIPFLRRLVARVNESVRGAAGRTGATFVPTQAAFAGHDACAIDRWLGPLFPVGGETLHPNLRGNLSMAAELTTAIGPPS